MITLDSKTTVGIWYLVLVRDNTDIMAAVTEVEPDKRYKLDYRFRYYADDKVFNSEDKKSWYHLEAQITKEKMISLARGMFTALEIAADGLLCEILNNTDILDFERRLKAAPFMHWKEPTEAEIAELGLDKGSKTQ